MVWEGRKSSQATSPKTENNNNKKVEDRQVKGTAASKTKGTGALGVNSGEAPLHLSGRPEAKGSQQKSCPDVSLHQAGSASTLVRPRESRCLSPTKELGILVQAMVGATPPRLPGTPGSSTNRPAAWEIPPFPAPSSQDFRTFRVHPRKL